MSDDELERLRAILSKTHSKQEPVGIVGKISRAVRGLFTRPKKAEIVRVEKKVDSNKKNAA